MNRKLKRNITTSKVFSFQPRDVKRYNKIKLLLTRTHSLDYQRSTIELHVSNHFLLLDFFFIFCIVFLSCHEIDHPLLNCVFNISMKTTKEIKDESTLLRSSHNNVFCRIVFWSNTITSTTCHKINPLADVTFRESGSLAST